MNKEQITYKMACYFTEEYFPRVKNFCNWMRNWFNEEKIDETLLMECRKSEYWNEDTYNKLFDNMRTLAKRYGSWDFQHPLAVYTTNEEASLYNNWLEYWTMIGKTDFCKAYFGISESDFINMFE